MDSSEPNAAFSAVLGESNPRHFLSCAQARRSIKRGCRAFLTLVTEADIADATLAAASKTGPDVTTFPVAETAISTEQADLLKHVDTLKEDFADVFAEPSGLPPDRGVEHVIPLLPDSQPPFQRMYRLAPSELQEVQRQITNLLSSSSLSPLPAPLVLPSSLLRRRLESSGWLWTTEL